MLLPNTHHDGVRDEEGRRERAQQAQNPLVLFCNLLIG